MNITHIDCKFDRAVLRDEMIAWSKKNSSAVDPVAAAAATAGMSNRICRQLGLFHNSNFPPPCPSGSAAESASAAAAAAENKDREVIIAMVTKAVTAITQRLTSLSTFDGTDSKVCIYLGCEILHLAGQWRVHAILAISLCTHHCSLLIFEIGRVGLGKGQQ